jgi:hypothetical protein
MPAGVRRGFPRNLIDPELSEPRHGGDQSGSWTRNCKKQTYVREWTKSLHGEKYEIKKYKGTGNGDNRGDERDRAHHRADGC